MSIKSKKRHKKTKSPFRRQKHIDVRRPGRFPQSTDWHVVAAVGLFALAAWASRSGEVTAVEESIFLFFYNVPDVVIPIFFALTQLGSIYMLGLLGVLYFFGKRYTIVIRLLMAGALAYLLAGVGKDLFGRGRPNELFDGIEFRDSMIRGPGFPSGHTAMAVALGLTLAHYAPPAWRWPILILTLLASVSRMVLGVHTPLDVVGGFAIGWGSAMLFRHVQVRDRS